MYPNAFKETACIHTVNIFCMQVSRIANYSYMHFITGSMANRI